MAGMSASHIGQDTESYARFSSSAIMGITAPMHRPSDNFVEQHQHRLLEELKDFLRIPSISTLPEHKPDIVSAADFVAESLRRAGIENVEIIATAGNPLIYGDWLHAAPG